MGTSLQIPRHQQIVTIETEAELCCGNPARWSTRLKFVQICGALVALRPPSWAPGGAGLESVAPKWERDLLIPCHAGPGQPSRCRNQRTRPSPFCCRKRMDTKPHDAVLQKIVGATFSRGPTASKTGVRPLGTLPTTFS